MSETQPLGIHTFVERQKHIITGQMKKLEMKAKCCWVRKENLEVEEEFKLGILAFIYYADNY